jgi:hypothetical protein
MRTTILAYLIAIVGLAMIVAGAWGLLNLLDPTIGIEMMAEGIGLVGLAQALRLLLEINRSRPALR